MEVKKYKNFFDEELYENVFQIAGQLMTSNGNFFCTNRHWQDTIILDSFPVLIHEIDKETDLHQSLKTAIENKTNLNIRDTAKIMIYYWTRYSYIPWHSDPAYDAGLTVYLNPRWDENYGGYFLYKDENDEIRGIIPEKNMGVLQIGGVPHCTTPVHFNGDMRVTLQTFFHKEPNKKNNKKIILFTASWSDSCRNLKEKLIKLQVDFEEFDINDHKSLTNQYNISSLPTLIMIENDLENKRITDLLNEEELLHWINN